MRYHWLLAYFPRSICDKAAAPMHLAKALSRVLSFQRGVSKILREDHVNHADYTPNLPPPQRISRCPTTEQIARRSGISQQWIYIASKFNARTVFKRFLTLV